MGDEPCFFIAAPLGLDSEPDYHGIPINASSLLLEWTCTLDPLAALRAAARDHFHLMASDWAMDTKHFVVPTYSALDLMRLAARDPDIVSAIETARLLLLQPHRYTKGEVEGTPMWSMVDEDVLNDRSLPVLYGLAVRNQINATESFHSYAAYTARREREKEIGEVEPIPEAKRRRPRA